MACALSPCGPLYPQSRRTIPRGSQNLDHETALTPGLFDRIVAPDALLPTARDIAADVLSAEHRHVATIKRMCRP
ncbi:hypothetical protein RAZWK3B_07114 [Roseobacter sp. AzwK-3b]|nr:hypothetical protein RAZWK3B_07114 [Roseobacter sp. AzwK-3b]